MKLSKAPNRRGLFLCVWARVALHWANRLGAIVDQQSFLNIIFNNGVLLTGIWVLLKVVFKSMVDDIKELKKLRTDDSGKLEAHNVRLVRLEDWKKNQDDWFGFERRRILEQKEP